MANAENAQNAAPAVVDPTTGQKIVPVDGTQPGATGVKTTKMDLDHDFNINGVQYNAGKGVEVNSDHVQAIKDNTDSHGRFVDWASTHHGAVPAPSDPMEATAQTPTRPLGADHVRVAVSTKPVVNEGDAVLVEDPNQGNEAATELANDAPVVSANDSPAQVQEKVNESK